MKAFLILVLLVFASAVEAHTPADGDVYAATGPFLYSGHARHSHFREPVLLSAALTAEADVTKYGGLEISMFYLRNPFVVEHEGQIFAEQLKRLMIATGYRHWLNPRVSLAAAFFSSYAIGNARVVRDDFGGLKHPGTSARDVTEYGLDFSVQYEPIKRDRYALVVDGRYGLSVTPKQNEDSNHFGILILLKYFVQSRSQI